MSSAIAISAGHYNSGTASSVADSTTSSAASGLKIIAAISWFGSANLSSVAGGSLTWQIDKQNSGSNHRTAIASADAPSGLASGTTITATFSGFVDAESIRVYSKDGLQTNAGGAVDGSGGANTSAATTNWSVSLTTTNATDYLFALDWVDFYTGGMAATSPGVEITDWTTVDGSELQVVEKSVTSSGAQTIGGTFTGSRTNAAVAVAYKVFVPSPTVAIDTIANVQAGVKQVTSYGGSTPQVSNRIWNAMRSGRARYIVVGDSYVQGTGASNRASSFTVKIGDTLRANHSLPGTGIGLLNFDDSASHTGTVVSDDTWTQSSGAQMTGSASVSWSMTGTAFDVVYRETPGAAVITVKVDGTTVGTITHPGSGSNVASKRANFSGLSAGAHTVQLVTTDTQFIDGIIPYSGDSATSGVSFYKVGRSGSVSAYWVSTNPNPRTGWSNFNPDAVFVEPVINDCWNNVPLATTQANLANQIAYARSLPGTPTVFMLIPFFTNFATFFDDGTASKNSLGLNLDDYRAAAITAATQAGAYVIDLRKYIPDPVGSGYLTSGHPNDAGHAAYATAIASFIDANDFPTTLNADPAVISVTGQSVGLVSVVPASIAVNGQTVGASASHPTIAVDTIATLNVTGQTVTATGAHTIAATPATVNLSGATVGTSQVVAVTPAAVTVTGATVGTSQVAAVAPATVTVTGLTVTPQGAHIIPVDTVPAVTVNGQSVTTGSGHPVVAADPSAITVTGLTVGTGQVAAVVPATVNVTGQTVVATGAHLMALTLAAVSINGAAVGTTSASPTVTVTPAAIALGGMTVALTSGAPPIPTDGVVLTISTTAHRLTVTAPTKRLDLDAGPARRLE